MKSWKNSVEQITEQIFLSINRFLFYWFLSKSKKETYHYTARTRYNYTRFSIMRALPPLSVKKWLTSHPHQYSVPHQYVNWRRRVFY